MTRKKAKKRAIKTARAAGAPKPWALAKAISSGYPSDILASLENIPGVVVSQETFCDCCGPEVVRITLNGVTVFARQ